MPPPRRSLCCFIFLTGSRQKNRRVPFYVTRQADDLSNGRDGRSRRIDGRKARVRLSQEPACCRAEGGAWNSPDSQHPWSPTEWTVTRRVTFSCRCATRWNEKGSKGTTYEKRKTGREQRQDGTKGELSRREKREKRTHRNARTHARLPSLPVNARNVNFLWGKTWQVDHLVIGHLCILLIIVDVSISKRSREIGSFHLKKRPRFLSRKDRSVNETRIKYYLVVRLRVHYKYWM